MSEVANPIAKFCPLCGEPKPEIRSPQPSRQKHVHYECVSCQTKFTVHNNTVENSPGVGRVMTEEEQREQRERLREPIPQGKDYDGGEF